MKQKNRYPIYFLGLFLLSVLGGCSRTEPAEDQSFPEKTYPLCENAPTYPSSCKQPQALAKDEDIEAIKTCINAAEEGLKFSKNQCYNLDDDRIAHLSPVDQDDVLFFETQINTLTKTLQDLERSIEEKKKKEQEEIEAKKQANEKSCNEAKASIDPVDLSLFQFNEDCSIAYYDSSKEKIVTLLDVKSFNTFFDVSFSNMVCGFLRNDLLTPGFSRRTFFRRESTSAALLIRRHRDRTQIDTLKEKYKGSKFQIYGQNNNIQGSKFKISLNEKNFANKKFKLFSESDYKKNNLQDVYKDDLTILEQLKYINQINIPAISDENGNIFVGQSLSISVSLSNIGYCFITKNSSIDLQSDEAKKRLLDLIELSPSLD